MRLPPETDPLLQRIFELMHKIRDAEASGLITTDLLRAADEVRIELAKFGFIVDR